MNENTDGTEPTSINPAAWPKAATVPLPPPRPPKAPKEPGKLQKFFSVRRNQYIGAGLVVLLLGGLITGGTIAAEQSRLEKVAAAAVAAEKKAAAEKAREEELAAEAKAEFEELIRFSTALSEEAVVFHTESAAWGTADTRAALLTAIATLQDAIEAEDETAIKAAMKEMNGARGAVGTLAEAQAKEYDALVIANGEPGKAGTDQGPKDCANAMESGMYDAADPTKLADYWTENSYVRIDAAVQVYCPELQPSVDIANRSISDGSRIVSKDIAAGTYKTVGAVSNCYWERSDGSGDIYDNNFISSALNGVTVRVYPGEQFETSGCGIWRLQ